MSSLRKRVRRLERRGAGEDAISSMDALDALLAEGGTLLEYLPRCSPALVSRVLKSIVVAGVSAPPGQEGTDEHLAPTR